MGACCCTFREHTLKCVLLEQYNHPLAERNNHLVGQPLYSNYIYWPKGLNSWSMHQYLTYSPPNFETNSQVTLTDLATSLFGAILSSASNHVTFSSHFTPQSSHCIYGAASTIVLSLVNHHSLYVSLLLISGAASTIHHVEPVNHHQIYSSC